MSSGDERLENSVVGGLTSSTSKRYNVTGYSSLMDERDGGSVIKKGRRRGEEEEDGEEEDDIQIPGSRGPGGIPQRHLYVSFCWKSRRPA